MHARLSDAAHSTRVQFCGCAAGPALPGPAMERRFFAPAAGDLSVFVYEEVFGAEPYEASYGINFFSAPRISASIC